MDAEKILDIGIRTGTLLMESGAEVYRVEDTIKRICKACKEVESVESYVTVTGIILTLSIHGKSYTRLCRIPKRSINLECIENINSLSRRVQNEDVKAEDVEKELDRIANKKTFPIWMTILSSAVGAAGFALFFNGNLKEIELSFIVGFLVRILYLTLNRIHINEYLNNLCSSILVALLAVYFSRLFSPVDSNTLIVSGIMLLIPGLAITNAIRDTVAGDYISGMVRTLEALVNAFAISLGVVVVLSVVM